MWIKNEENKIAFAGLLWLISGIVTILFGMYLSLMIECSCPAIPIGAAGSYSTPVCSCLNGLGFIYTGIASFFLGFGIIVLRKNIFELRRRMSQRSRITKQ